MCTCINMEQKKNVYIQSSDCMTEEGASLFPCFWFMLINYVSVVICWQLNSCFNKFDRCSFQTIYEFCVANISMHELYEIANIQSSLCISVARFINSTLVLLYTQPFSGHYHFTFTFLSQAWKYQRPTYIVNLSYISHHKQPNQNISNHPNLLLCSDRAWAQVYSTLCLIRKPTDTKKTVVSFLLKLNYTYVFTTNSTHCKFP